MTTLEETLKTMNTPKHYMGNGVITCRDAMRSMMDNFHSRGDVIYWWGCIFKYIWRWPYKGGAEDLLKARACIDYLIESLPGGDDS